jgi:hypothetical protein
VLLQEFVLVPGTSMVKELDMEPSRSAVKVSVLWFKNPPPPGLAQVCKSSHCSPGGDRLLSYNKPGEYSYSPGTCSDEMFHC